MSEEMEQDGGQEQEVTTADVDGRVLPDEPVRKDTNPYQDAPTYLCPHCVLDVTPASHALTDGGSGDDVPEEVRSHIRQCDGIKGYQLGLKARRRQKRRLLGQHQSEISE